MREPTIDPAAAERERQGVEDPRQARRERLPDGVGPAGETERLVEEPERVGERVEQAQIDRQRPRLGGRPAARAAEVARELRGVEGGAVALELLDRDPDPRVEETLERPIHPVLADKRERVIPLDPGLVEERPVRAGRDVEDASRELSAEAVFASGEVVEEPRAPDALRRAPPQVPRQRNGEPRKRSRFTSRSSPEHARESICRPGRSRGPARPRRRARRRLRRSP